MGSVSTHLYTWRYAVSQPVCVCFFRCMATEHSGPWSLRDVSGLSQPGGLLPAFISWGSALLLLCTYATGRSVVNIRKQKRWNGHRFSDQSMIHVQ